jgi:hypothetical protein
MSFKSIYNKATSETPNWKDGYDKSVSAEAAYNEPAKTTQAASFSSMKNLFGSSITADKPAEKQPNRGMDAFPEFAQQSDSIDLSLV